MEDACKTCGGDLPAYKGRGPRPIYCPPCRLASTRSSQRASNKRPEYVARVNAERRRRSKEDPAFAERHRLAMHRYRVSNTEKIAAGKKRWAQANREKVHRSVDDHKRRYPDREWARRMVRDAIRTGRLIRQSCWCGEAKAEAHHHKGYDLAHVFDVVWLCRPHHKELERVYPR